MTSEFVEKIPAGRLLHLNIIHRIRSYRLFSLSLGSFRLNPGVISTIVTLVLLYTMISLGFWQLERAEFKDTLQQKIEERKTMPVSALEQLSGTIDERRFVPTEFMASYDAEHSFYLDNRIYNGRVGYHVFTPAVLDDERSVLIARGFVALGESRDELPEAITPAGKVRFKGLLEQEPPRGLVLADDANQSGDWPVVLQYLDLDEVSDMLGYELYDMVLWLDEDSDKENGVLTYDLPVLNLDSAKNTGYAFQWFAMSFALLLIYLFVNLKRDTENNQS